MCIRDRNLYPFEQVARQPDATLDALIENIDIGGPAMLRSAAKNHARVAVATDPDQYPALIDTLQRNDGHVGADTRWRLAVAAFQRVAAYDAAIADTLGSLQPDGSRTLFPTQANGTVVKVMDLRYGENPHQQAAFYRDLHPAPGSLATFRQVQGLSLIHI